MRLFLTAAVFAAFSLAMLTSCQKAAAPVNVEKAQVSTESKAPAQPDAHDDGAPRIALADAKRDFDAGNTVFVDTRSETQYKQEHIKGSLNIPLAEADARIKDIPSGKKIIAYCS